MSTTGKKKDVAKDVTVKRSKERMDIVVPDRMSLKEAIKWLTVKDQEEDKTVALAYEIPGFPLDGAVALTYAIDDIYGFFQKVDIPGDFFTPDQPPVMVGVQTSLNETITVPWGRLKIPGVAGYIETHAHPKKPMLFIGGQIKQRHVAEIERLIAKTKEFILTRSVYKGKAFTLDLSWRREGRGQFNPLDHAPRFTIDTTKVNPDGLVLPKPVMRDVTYGLFTPIEHSEVCRKHGIPLKRGILAAGPYGTGKTLMANVAAKKAVDNGWTFINLTSVIDLAEAFKFAAFYAPCVIFAEDVDRVVSGDRSAEMDAILNTFDGVDSKNHEIITVLTTNHVERMNQAILRPGRCDTLVTFSAPDADAAARLVQLYGRGLIAQDADLTAIGRSLDGHIPAEIREAIERAKLTAIARLAAEGVPAAEITVQDQVTTQDILDAVRAMENQHKLLEPKKQDNRSLVEKGLDAFGQRVANAVSSGAQKQAVLGIRMLQEAGFAGMENLIQAASELYDLDGQEDDKPLPALLNGQAE